MNPQRKRKKERERDRDTEREMAVMGEIEVELIDARQLKTKDLISKSLFSSQSYYPFLVFFMASAKLIRPSLSRENGSLRDHPAGRRKSQEQRPQK